MGPFVVIRTDISGVSVIVPGITFLQDLELRTGLHVSNLVFCEALVQPCVRADQTKDAQVAVVDDLEKKSKIKDELKGTTTSNEF